MTSTCSVEDVVDAADGWHLFGTECPREEIVFLCQEPVSWDGVGKRITLVVANSE